jgi:hypothetical protein
VGFPATGEVRASASKGRDTRRPGATSQWRQPHDKEDVDDHKPDCCSRGSSTNGTAIFGLRLAAII